MSVELRLTVYGLGHLVYEPYEPQQAKCEPKASLTILKFSPGFVVCFFRTNFGSKKFQFNFWGFAKPEIDPRFGHGSYTKINS